MRKQAFAAGANIEFGDPQATAEAILKIVDVDAEPVARAAYANRLATWESWGSFPMRRRANRRNTRSRLCS
jgi:hypothetical protein